MGVHLVHTSCHRTHSAIDGVSYIHADQMSGCVFDSILLSTGPHFGFAFSKFETLTSEKLTAHHEAIISDRSG